MERWQQICDEIDPTEVNKTINEVKDLHLPMMSKMNIIEGREMFNPSFEYYLN